MDLSSLLTSNDMLASAQVKPFHPPPPPGATTPHASGPATTPKSLSPNGDCKAVSFRLRDSHCEPKTFYIRPHDTTDSIMDTVKHLFGMSRQYDLGISLEDADGLSFIPSYENFLDGMPVYVRIEDSLRSNLVYRHPYNLRQSQGMSNRSSAFPTSRSVSPQSNGRRSTSATVMQLYGGRGRSLKRSALHLDSDAEQEMIQQDGLWYRLPHQSLLPEDEEEPRTKAASVASADISVENIVEGSRRKRPKFSSDELPLFPPITLPKQDDSLSSSPAHRVPQLATPYSNRHFSFCHPMSPSNTGGQRVYRSSGSQAHYNGSGVVPTPAPTVTSCISDEDVAIQLMRLGTVNTSTATTMSTTDEMRDGFSSDCGDFGDYDGRSDTTELPDPLPVSGLPLSPILYPRDRKFKSLDEILPSFDTTEPSDDDDSENQPPDHPFVSRPPKPCQESVIRAPRAVQAYDEDADTCDDEGDETYVAKEEDEDPDYEDDLEDMPLKMRRESKVTAATSALQTVFPSISTPMTVRVLHSKPTQQLPRGIAKIIIRRKQPAPLQARPQPPVVKQEPHYPISPASPPASRKPSVSSSVSSGKANNARPNGTVNPGLNTPLSPDQPESLAVGEPTEPADEPRPRCQRCRKSKKGCDRQRPCQRCKDAGIPADQCISEDEVGTRRGRQVATAAKKAIIDKKSNGFKNKKKKV